MHEKRGGWDVAASIGGTLAVLLSICIGAFYFGTFIGCGLVIIVGGAVAAVELIVATIRKRKPPE